MFRNLLVHIPTERSARPAVDGSISLAMACNAHLDAIATGYVSTNIPFVAEGGAAVASIYALDLERAEERAASALAVFEVEAKLAGISHSSRAVACVSAEASSILVESARLHDLTIVSQPEPDHASYDNHLPQDILFQSGGPVLFLPYTFHGAFKAKRIGICWDGSRVAVRALRDAMPLLGQADALKVIAINADAELIAPTPAKLGAYLASLALPATIISLAADRSDIQPSILSLAADENLDLLVMGGYGHSHLQELIVGGVTREMLRAMTVPTLMSH
jgi:nucleotide-binding universal stress UspA family protein